MGLHQQKTNKNPHSLGSYDPLDTESAPAQNDVPEDLG